MFFADKCEELLAKKKHFISEQYLENLTSCLLKMSLVLNDFALQILKESYPKCYCNE